MQYMNLLTDCSSSNLPIPYPSNVLIMSPKFRSTPYNEFNLKLHKESNSRRRRKRTLWLWQHKWLLLRGRLHWLPRFTKRRTYDSDNSPEFVATSMHNTEGAEKV